MEYKFELYKIDDYLGSQGDIDVPDVYNFDDYIFERLLNPVWSDLGKKWKKEGERKFFRENLTGTLEIKNDKARGITDFTYLNNLRTSDVEICKPRILVIKNKCDGAWQTFWRGFFKLKEGKWDLARKSVTFKEIDVFDRFSRLLENMKVEVDIITNNWQDSFQCLINRPTYNYEQETDYIGQGAYTPEEPQDWEWEELGYEWVLYKKIYKLLSVVGNAGYYSLTKIYRRDVVESQDNPGAGWSQGEEIYEGSGIYYWYRNYRNTTTFTYTEKQVPSNLVPGYYDISYVLETEYDNPVLNSRGRNFIEVIDSIVQDYLGYTGFKSELLRGSVNPITGADPNNLNNLVLFQITDLRTTSDAATKGIITFEDLERWMRAMFNAYVYVDEDNYLRFEHYDFFDKNLSYSVERSVGIDLSNEKRIENINEISYGDLKIPRYEEFEHSDSFNEEFIGETIKYNSYCANKKEGEDTVLYETRNLATDLLRVVQNPDAVRKDSFFLLITEWEDNGTGIYFYYSYPAESALTGEQVENGELSIPNLQEAYFKHGRPLSQGMMNLSLVEFESVIRNVEQEDISFEICCDDFNPYRLIRTPYGDGYVEEADYKMKDGIMTVKLTYDA